MGLGRHIHYGFALAVGPWLMSWFIYRFGIIENPAPSWAFYFYMIAATGSMYIAFRLGVNAGWADRWGKSIKFERIWLPLAIFGVVCALIWIADLRRGGYDARNTLEDTAMVRHKHLGVTSLATTLTSPFVCASFCGLSYIVYSLVFWRRNVSWLFLVAALATVLGFCFVTFLQVSRNGMMQFMILAGYAFVFLGVKNGLQSLRSLTAIRALILFAGLVAAGVYFIFITVSRQDDYQYEAGINATSLRFNIPMPKTVEATLVNGNYYFSHSVGNFDRILSTGHLPILGYDTNWLGYMTQALLKIGINVEPDYEYQDRLRGYAGVHPAEWPSGFFYIITDFGILGSFAFLAGLGFLLGLATISAITKRDFGSLFFFSTLASLTSQLILYYPGTQNSWISMYVAAVLFGISYFRKIKFI